MDKKLITLAVIGIILLTAVLFFKGSAAGTATLWNWSNGGTWLLPLVIVAALMDSINPCAFSILILTIAFLFNIGKLRSDILKIGGIYILGIFLVYLAIGLGILQTLHLFNTPHFMAKVGATLLVAMGLLSVVNHLFPRFPVRLKIPHASHARIAQLMEKASMPAAFILGGLVGLCEFPCTGGPYLLVLGLLHDQATYLKGLGYLILYNAIFVLPLAVILLISSNKTLLEKVKTWKQANTGAMRLWGGIAMILLGLIIFII